MKRPVEPKEDDCCNSGCNPCIFDVYEKQIHLYKRYLEGDEDNIDPEVNGISQLEYTTLVVVDNINLCDSHNILAFRTSSNKKIWWKPGDHFLFKYSSDDYSCTRAYTPVKIKVKTKETFDFIVIIKKYDNGLVSKYLCNLKPGALTLWRGPYGNYELIQNKFSRIIMIAQGTGIAPFFSILENILYNEEDMTKIILLYCCQNIHTILLREELYLLKSYWNFTYHVYLSNMTQNQTCKYQEPIINKRFSVEECEYLRPFSSTDKILLCGSSQFMEEYNIWLINECNVLSENIHIF